MNQVVLKLKRVSESPGVLLNHIAGPHPPECRIQKIRGGAREFAFPASSHVILMLPAQVTHLDNHWPRDFQLKAPEGQS